MKLTAVASVPSADFVIGLPPISVTTPSYFLSGQASSVIFAFCPSFTFTTHLQNLLSADANLRSLPYWEAQEPVPVPGEEPAAGAEDPRILRSRQSIAMQDDVIPLFKLMLNLQAERVHEEIQLLAIDFSTMFFETLAPLHAGATTTWPTTRRRTTST